MWSGSWCALRGGLEAQRHGAVVGLAAQAQTATAQQVDHRHAVKAMVAGPFADADASGRKVGFDLLGGFDLRGFHRVKMC